ncbi:hypothetical protein BH11PSE9_BH11PSE9_09960 [soil metagenome]
MPVTTAADHSCMNDMRWNISPDELGAFDGAIARYIAGEVPAEDLLELCRVSGVDVWRRVAGLMDKHLQMRPDDLAGLALPERHRLANALVEAETDEQETMPGELVPLERFWS